MRKLAFVLAVLSCLTFAACGGKDQTEKTTDEPRATASGEGVKPSESSKSEDKKPKDQKNEDKTEGSAAASTVTPAPSTNKTVVTEENAPKVYWAMDMVYHLKGCKDMKKIDSREIPWSAVKELGLRQCPTCNPPRYENYAE